MTPDEDLGLTEEVALAFERGGLLTRADAQFTPREGQTRLALAVAQAIEERSVLVAEAGTGVGKTYAYLVPLLLSGLRAMVSTATKSLQDQLYLRDLPRLVRALGLPVQVALLKGRAAYVCPHRLEQARHVAELPDRHSVHMLTRVEMWARSTRSGDLAEVEGLDERSPLMPWITSTRDNCLGSDCEHFRACPVVVARREAMQADIVVVNHHLFFADLSLRDTGTAELLPSVDAVVFDEAHQLNEAGVQFLGRQIGSGQVIDIARDLLAGGLAHARGVHDWPGLSAGCELAARTLRLAAAGPLRTGARLRWEERADRPDFDLALAGVRAALMAVHGALVAVAGASPDLDRLCERVELLRGLVEDFRAPLDHGRVRWIDLGLHQVRLLESPLDIRDTMRHHVETARQAWVFTSATLGDDPELSWFTRSAGLEEARTLQAESPFPYADHARLYVPTRFPRPSDAGHGDAVAGLAKRCVEALGGRTFVLTTTLRALQAIGSRLRDQLALSIPPVEVLIQGEGPKRALLARYLSLPRAVLVGSHSFWEGIDVPGKALQCVIIDKLPFPPPNDPIVEARCQGLEAEGGNAFQDYFVPEAAIALKQGAGRLIRSETDRGLLVIADLRLATMPYGRRLRAALPPMPLLTSEDEALEWLKGLSDEEGEEASVSDGPGVLR